MTEIVLVRHGETAWNAEEVFRGRADVALNEVGRQQAGLLAHYLGRDIYPEGVYCSPLKRAIQTAEPVTQRGGLALNVAGGLTDLDFGEWQGLSAGEVMEKYPVLYWEWLGHPEQVRLPGGENLEDVRKRGLAVISRVLHRHQVCVALVTHRVVTKVLVFALLGLPVSRFWNVRQDTCGVTIFSYNAGRFILTRHNDTSFLEPLRMATRNDF